MKECDYGRIPPCYGSLERAIYEEAKKANDEWKKSRARHIKMIDKMRNKLMEGGFLDDTHEKVYELNRQMCDIDKHLSKAGYFRMICDGQIETRKKLIDMEEKKTKKMTKAEAFEWLKGKKVNTKGKGEEVQTKLFECGFSWVNGQCRYYGFSDYLLFETDGKLWHCGNCVESYWRLHHFEEISVDDILSIEIVEEKYELEFNYDKVVELAEPLMHYLNEVGCPDGIRVSQLGIVHEPMSTLIFDNGIGRI